MTLLGKLRGVQDSGSQLLLTLHDGTGSADVRYFLHNHLRFTVLYNRDAGTDLSRIVGFEVEAFSVKHEYDKPWDATGNGALNTCNPGRMIAVSHTLPPQPADEGAEVVFSYDVKFTPSDIRWASRWDTYLKVCVGVV